MHLSTCMEHLVPFSIHAVQVPSMSATPSAPSKMYLFLPTLFAQQLHQIDVVIVELSKQLFERFGTARWRSSARSSRPWLLSLCRMTWRLHGLLLLLTAPVLWCCHTVDQLHATPLILEADENALKCKVCNKNNPWRKKRSWKKRYRCVRLLTAS